MKYVLMTSAYNEQDSIERLMDSVASQSVLPSLWIIVDDGSMDRTAQLVRQRMSLESYIHLERRKPSVNDFASKARALNAAYQRIKERLGAESLARDWVLVGVLDADLSFDSDYFSSLCSRFAQDATLGIAGGQILQVLGGKSESQRISENSVAGAVQMFRRECFDQIGGFLPLSNGGEDAAAEIMARMNGWKVRTFSDLQVLHHGRVVSGSKGPVHERFKRGMLNYELGYSPAFHLLSCLGRVDLQPYIFGSVLCALGYGWAYLNGRQHCLPSEVVTFLRSEQRHRMRGLLSSKKSGVIGHSGN